MPYVKPLNFDYDIIRGWYKTPPVKFEIIRSLYNREFALLVPKHKTDQLSRSTRTLKVHSVQHLDVNLNAVEMFKRETYYNFYYSLAIYKNGIPNQTLNFQERDNTDWKRNHHKEMVGYDWLIDIDAGDFDDVVFAYYSARNIKRLFDKLDVPYELRYSGMGFHFIIPYKYLPQDLSFNPDDDINIYRFLHDLTKKIHDQYSEMIDLKIYDSRRVCKIPYSLALYPDDALICHPFYSDEGFDNFKKKGCVIYKSLYNLRPMNYKYNLGFRGLHIFNKDGNITKLLIRYDMVNYKDKLKNKGGVDK